MILHLLNRKLPRKKKILLIEDNAVIQIYTERLLVDIGFEVCGTASNIEEVELLLNNCSPDLILADIGLNGKQSGIEVANRINSNRSIPVIFVTGNTDPEILMQAQKTNPLLILSKPLDEEKLRRAFEKLNIQPRDFN